MRSWFPNMRKIIFFPFFRENLPLKGVSGEKEGGSKEGSIDSYWYETVALEV